MRMSYTLYDKDMGTEEKVTETFWGLNIDPKKNYELVGETELGVTIRWTHVYDVGADTDIQECKIKCAREGCDSWMPIDPKYLSRIERFSCIDCIRKYGYNCADHGTVEDVDVNEKPTQCSACALEDSYIDYLASAQGIYEQYSDAARH